MNVRRGKSTPEGYVHTVEYGYETFPNVKNIPKFKHCTSSSCKYYSDCCSDGGVVRRFDCRKTLKRFLFWYNWISATLIFLLTAKIFALPNVQFFTKLGFLVMVIVIFDVICSLLELIIPNVRDRLFYRKLMKHRVKEKAREEKERKAEEQKLARERQEMMSQTAYYQKVVRAEVYVNNLKKLMDEHDFGENSSKIMDCAKQLDGIVNILKEDNSYYSRVAFLFENVLIEFFDTLKLYVQLLKSGVDSAKFETIINASINKFQAYLTEQTDSGLFVEDSIIKQFQRSAKSLSRLIDENGGESL